MRRRRRDIADEIEALELQHGRPSSRRVEADLPPEIIAAMDARLDAEADAWLADFDAALSRALKRTPRTRRAAEKKN